MKKIFFLQVLLATLIYSCHKNSNATTTASPSVYITAEASGTALTFNTGITVSLDSSGGLYNLVLHGSSDTGVNARQMTIVIDSSKSPITTGVYPLAGPGVAPVKLLFWWDNHDGPYANDTAHGSYQPEVTITSISNTNVQGTFSGPLLFYPSNLLTVRSINISNGKFNVDF